MSQDRFIELLNLYLDEAISTEDLSDLMSETRSDPERQKVFFEYCRIHKACVQMGGPFESSPARRSIRQTIYAIGGLAAAFALLGMAGRNLMPYFGDQEGEVVAVQQVNTDGNVLFFPDFASEEILTPRFVAGNEEPRIHYMTPGDGGTPVWSNGTTLARVRSTFGDGGGFIDSRALLDTRSLELKDPFNGFSEFGDSIEFSKAPIAPAKVFGSGLESSLSLK